MLFGMWLLIPHNIVIYDVHSHWQYFISLHITDPWAASVSMWYTNMLKPIKQSSGDLMKEE